MKTRVTEVLGIEYPIIQGAMAWITDHKIVSAVSNAGGAGVIAASSRDPDWLKQEIRKTKSMTDKPFGVNVSMRDSIHKDRLIDVTCEESVDFVTLGAGDPRKHIDKLHSAGIKTIAIVPSTRLAKRVEEAGIDLIIVEGTEAGGRIGTLTTFSLLTNVIPQVQVPVIAAGGIVDGRGIAASFIMGAEGVQMGSRFLLAEECYVHPDYKNKIIEASDEDSVGIGLSRNLGYRGLKSPYAEKFREMETNGAPLEELKSFLAGMSRRVAEEGLGKDGMNGMIQVGQSLLPLRKIQPVKEIINEVIKEAELLLINAPNIVRN